MSKDTETLTLKPKLPTGVDPLLAGILCTKRSHNSVGELNFVKWLYDYLKGLGVEARTMAEGAIAVEVGEGGKTLFSCHVDTMHTHAQSDGSAQNIVYDEAFGHVFLADKTQGGCLGADDGVGVYIMLKMIAARITGSYIFHRGEERGCISSRAVLEKNRSWLKNFDACIAFDRPWDNEVIVTQTGAVCASIEYGKQLADALNANGANLKYEVSHKGVITDSKIYRQVIPECINIGVGYSEQHSANEYQDVMHLEDLLAACLKLDWAALKPKRVIVPEPEFNGKAYNDFTPKSWKQQEAWAISDSFKSKPKGKGGKPKLAEPPPPPEPKDIDFTMMSFEEIMDEVGSDEAAQAIARLICDLDAEKARVDRLKFLLGV